MGATLIARVVLVVIRIEQETWRGRVGARRTEIGDFDSDVLFAQLTSRRRAHGKCTPVKNASVSKLCYTKMIPVHVPAAMAAAMVTPSTPTSTFVVNC